MSGGGVATEHRLKKAVPFGKYPDEVPRVKRPSRWITVIPFLSAKGDCQNPRMVHARSSFQCFIRDIAGKDVFDRQIGLDLVAHFVPPLHPDRFPAPRLASSRNVSYLNGQSLTLRRAKELTEFLGIL
jgi:hypothetical protein